MQQLLGRVTASGAHEYPPNYQCKSSFFCILGDGSANRWGTFKTEFSVARGERRSLHYCILLFAVCLLSLLFTPASVPSREEPVRGFVLMDGTGAHGGGGIHAFQFVCRFVGGLQVGARRGLDDAVAGALSRELTPFESRADVHIRHAVRPGPTV